MYDLAWCTIWGRCRVGIGELGLFEPMVPFLTEADASDLALRHRVDELHIGVAHFGRFANLGDDSNLGWTARRLDELLEEWARPIPGLEQPAADRYLDV